MEKVTNINLLMFISEIETEILTDKRNQLWEKLIDELPKLISDKEYISIMQSHHYVVDSMLARIGMVILNLILSEEIKIDKRLIAKLFLFRRVINTTIEASPFDDARHIIRAILNKYGNRVTEKTISNILLISTLDNIDGRLIDYIITAQNESKIVYGLSLLTDRMVFSENGKNAQARLLESLDVNSNLPKIIDHLPLVALVWFQCSYSCYENKHVIKQDLNNWIKGFIDSNIVLRRTSNAMYPSAPTQSIAVVKSLS